MIMENKIIRTQSGALNFNASALNPYRDVDMQTESANNNNEPKEKELLIDCINFSPMKDELYEPHSLPLK